MAEIDHTTSPHPGAGTLHGGVAGFSRLRLPIPHGKPLAGYSLGGSGKGAWTRNPMHVRAMFLEDAHGERVGVAVMDLMSASRYLHERVAGLTSAGCNLGLDRLILCGTHTHTGPGGFFGNSLYDTFAAHAPGFDQGLADTLADTVAAALAQAVSVAAPVTVRVDIERVWGVSRNRSLPAFQSNEDDLLWNTLPSMPGFGPPAGLSVEQQRVDPRVTVLSAYNAAGRRIGVFATFACHNTALGQRPKTGRSYYDPDWTGVAARVTEADTDGPEVVMVALSGAGDQTPMPPSDGNFQGPTTQGPARADWVGSAVADAIRRTNRRGAADSIAPTLKVRHRDWWTVSSPQGSPDWNDLPNAKLAPWCFGASTLAGSEDGRSMFFKVLVDEGKPTNDYPPGDMQHPKDRALGVLQPFLARLLALSPSPVHALHTLRVNDHTFATVPGEPTAWAAYQIEESVRAASGSASASVLGYAGDYAGYFTTRSEFRAQHYEGASTLYGIASCDHLTQRLTDLAAGRSTRGTEAVSRTAGSLPGAKAAAYVEPGSTLPAPTGQLEAGHIVAGWTFARGEAPTEFPVEVTELGGGEERVLVSTVAPRIEPMDVWLGTMPVTLITAVIPVEGGTSGRRFRLSAGGSEIELGDVRSGPAEAAAGSDAMGGSGRAHDDPLEAAHTTETRRFRALLATWNSFGVPQAENMMVAFAPDARWPARYASGLLRGRCDSADVLCVQELIGTSARGLFDQLASHAHRIRRGGVLLEDHGLGIASRLAVEHTEELRFAERGTGFDKYIHKGALHARVKLTRGPIMDVVTTHLQAGSAPEARAARSAQLAELMAFVRKVSDPGRPLLVCGDFNIHGSDPGQKEYVALVTAMRAEGLQDLDAVQRRATCDPARNELLRQHEPGATATRLDYLFLRVPMPDRFMLGVEAVRLFLDQPLDDIRPSWKATTGLSIDPFASDHFGLSVELSYVPLE